MKSISAELKAHLSLEVTTLATCWKVTRRDHTVLGFTDHDQDIEYESVTYLATTGFTPTAIESTAALNVDSLDVEGMLDSNAITEQDMLAGLYDFAQVDVFMLNYEDTSQGVMTLRTGWLGEIIIKKGRFIAEIRGLTQHLSQTVGELYSPSCRANLGDSRCGVNMATLTENGSITAVTSQAILTDSSRTEEGGYFAFGKITFISGANSGLSMEVKEYSGGKFVLVLPMPKAIEVGDHYSVTVGCDKTLPTCIDRFNNAVNFRGEPHIPGTDRLLETSSTRSDW